MAASLISHVPFDSDALPVLGELVLQGDEGVIYGLEGANSNTGGAAFFDGTSGARFATDPAENPDSFTMMAWVKPNSGPTGSFQSIVTSRNDTENRGHMLYKTDSGNWEFWSGTGPSGGGWTRVPGTATAHHTAVVPGQWQHIALEVDAVEGSRKLYIDGKRVGSEIAPAVSNNATVLTIGAGGDFGTGHFFTGHIDDFALFDDVLTESEISYMMEHGVGELGDPRIFYEEMYALPFVGGTQDFTIGFQNSGEFQELFANGVTFEGGNSNLFSLVQVTSSLNPESAGQVVVRFTPGGVSGLVETTMVLATNDPINPAARIALKGLVPNLTRPTLVAHFPLNGDGDSADGLVEADYIEAVDFIRLPASQGMLGSGAFDGAGSVMQYDWSEFLNPESFTVCVWARSRGGAADWHSVLTNRNDEGDGLAKHGYLLYDTKGVGDWRFWSGDGMTSNWQVSGGASVGLGRWQHLALTYDHASQMKTAYVDGVVVSSATQLVSRNLRMPFNIGGGGNLGDRFWFDGLIDDLGVWDGALTATEIVQVKDSGVAFFGPDPGLQFEGVCRFEPDDSATQEFDSPIANGGASQNLTVSAISVSGEAANHFTVDTSSLPLVVPPGGLSSIDFVFEPMGEAGIFEAVFEITSDDPKIGLVEMPVRGVIRDPQIFSGDSLDFDRVTSAVSLPYRITNLATQHSLEILSHSFTGPDADHFSIVTDPSGVAPGSFGDLVIGFDPTGELGDFDAVLVLEVNDIIAPTKSVRLRASAGDSPPLIAHWPLDDVPGTSVGVTEVTGDHLGIADGVTFGEAGARSYTGNSARFDGVSSVLTIPADPELGATSYTLCFWAKADPGLEEWNALFSCRRDRFVFGLPSEGYTLFAGYGGNWSYWSAGGKNANDWQVLDGPAVKADAWHHIAIRYDGYTERKEIIVDGVSVASQYERITPNRTTDYYLGADGGSLFFEGYLDDVGLFGAALGIDEIDFVRMNGIAALDELGGEFPEVPKFLVASVSLPDESDGITFRWTAEIGVYYVIERTTDLGEWEVVAGPLRADADLEEVELDSSAGGDSPVMVYYRVSVAP